MFKKITIYILLFSITVISCSGRNIIQNRWEGFDHEKKILRTYSRYLITDDDEEKDFNKKIKAHLIIENRNRAITLLVSSLSLKVPLSEVKKIEPLILKIINNGKIIFFTCNENFCEMSSDYKISDIPIFYKKYNHKSTDKM